MGVDFKQLHLARLRNHPPSLRTAHFAQGVTVQYYDHPGLEIGSVLWPGASAMSDYLLSHPGLLTGARVLELGSGVGVAGLVAAHLAASVHLTDKPELLPLLQQNIAANGCSNVSAFAYCWGDPPPAELFTEYDVIIGADVLYSAQGYPGLMDTFRNVGKSGTRLLLTYKIRGLGEEQFLQQLQRQYTVSESLAIGEVMFMSFVLASNPLPSA